MEVRSSEEQNPDRDNASDSNRAEPMRSDALESLLDASACVAYGRFRRDGVLVRANPRFRALIGETAQEVRLPDLVVDGQHERMTLLLRSGEPFGLTRNVHFAAGDRVPTTLHLLWSWDGDEFVVLGEPPLDALESEEAALLRLNSRVSALARQNAKTSGRLFDELLRSNEELKVANREFQEFAYSIAHELRSPLRALDGFSLILLEDYADRLDEAGREHLARIRAASQRMADLVDSQLALARTGRLQIILGDVDVTALARRIIDLKLTEERARGVKCTVAEGLMEHTDAVLAGSVLDCLLDNALKFTLGKEAASIEVGCEVREAERFFFVRDNGVGFDQSYADRLFLPFERLHGAEEFAGVGIGLSTVRRLLNRIGGRCWAEGEVGKGAVVWFTLTGETLTPAVTKDEEAGDGGTDDG